MKILIDSSVARALLKQESASVEVRNLAARVLSQRSPVEVSIGQPGVVNYMVKEIVKFGGVQVTP